MDLWMMRVCAVKQGEYRGRADDYKVRTGADNETRLRKVVEWNQNRFVYLLNIVSSQTHTSTVMWMRGLLNVD